MKRLAERESPLVRVLKRWDARLLRWSFDKLAPLVGIVGVLVLMAGAGAWFLPRAFLPPFNEGTLTVGMTFQPGISLAESNRLGSIAERLIQGVPEVRSVGRRVGRAELDEHAEGVHSTEMDVDLRPGRPKEQVLTDLRQRVAVLPAAFNIGQPIGHRLEHLLSGVNAAIAVKLFGDDLDTLRGLAEDLRAHMGTIPGLVDLLVERQVRVPQLQVHLDYDRAVLYGVTPAALADTLEKLSNGKVVSQVVDGWKRFDVVLRLSDPGRTTEALAGLLVETPRPRAAANLRGRGGGGRAEPGSARERPAPHRGPGQHGRLRHGPHHRGDPGRSRADAVAAGLLRGARGHVPSAGTGGEGRWCRDAAR